MLLPVIAVLGGFVGLIWSADRFVAGAAAAAKLLGMSTLLIGLTIVSLGTSAPEIIVSVNAALSDAGELAIGNALGSNLANIGLVLALTLMIARVPISPSILKSELPVLLLVTLAAGWCLADHTVSLIDGIMLIAILLFLAVMLYLRLNQQQERPDAEEEILDMTAPLAAFWFFFGLLLLIVSAKALVWGATAIATELGVSELVIGLTVVAVGTSLPELAASVMSAIKGHHDIALGNIIGSNILNILAVMSLPGLISPPTLSAEVFNRDFAAMAAITGLLVVFMLFSNWRSKGTANTATLGAPTGILLLLGYGAYYAILAQTI